MALAKYEMTKQGKGIKASNKSTNFDIPSTSSAGRMETAMNSVVSKKQSNDQSLYFKNLRNAMLTGKMGEIEYYTTVASAYGALADTEQDPSKRMGYENTSLVNMQSAQNAAERNANKASSAADKLELSKLTDIKDNLGRRKVDMEIQLKSGGYASVADYYKDKNELFEDERDAYKAVSEDDSFSASSQRSAVAKVYEMEAEYKTPNASGEYGGVKFKVETAANWAFVQNTSKEGGNIPGEITEYYLEGAQGKQPGDSMSEGGSVFVMGSNGIWAKAEKLVKQNKDTGLYEMKDPNTGQVKELPYGEAEYNENAQKMTVTFIDPVTREEKSYNSELNKGGKFSGNWIDPITNEPTKALGFIKNVVPGGEGAAELSQTQEFKDSISAPERAMKSIFGEKYVEPKDMNDIFAGKKPEEKVEVGMSVKPAESPFPSSPFDAIFKKESTENKMSIKKDEQPAAENTPDFWDKAQKVASGGFSSFKKFLKQ